MTLDNQYSVAALYAGGWTYDDRDDLSLHYNLDEYEVEKICDGLLMEEFEDVAHRKIEMFNAEHDITIRFYDVVTDFSCDMLRDLVQDGEEVDMSAYVDRLIKRVEAGYHL